MRYNTGCVLIKTRSAALNSFFQKIRSLWNMSLPPVISGSAMLDPHNCVFICSNKTTIHLSAVMEEKLRERNRIKGFYTLVVRYDVEERVAWMPDLVDWVSSWVGGLCAARRLRRIRYSHSMVTQELVTGDVMRSDYSLVPKLAAKGWLTIPQPLKECFVRSGWKRGEKRDGENEEEGRI